MDGDPKYPGVAGDPGLPVRALRRADRPHGDPRRRPDALGAAWDEALAADRPVVLEVIVDPEVPPLPPHITLRAGEDTSPRRWRRATRTARRDRQQSFKGKLQEFRSRSRADERGRRRRAPTSRSSALAVSAYTDPDRRAGVRRHARVGLDHARPRRGATRAARRGLGYRYATPAVGRADRTSSLPTWSTAPTRSTPADAYGRRWGARCATSGRPGIASMAIAAVDVALWDLKARLLGRAARDAARRVRTTRCRSTAAAASPRTRSSGLREQLGGWVADGHPAGEDEGRPRAGPRSGSVSRRARGDRRTTRAVRRRERRVRPKQALGWARGFRGATGA